MRQRLLSGSGMMAAAVLLAGLLLLTGCQPGDVTSSVDVAQFVDNLKTFVEDFARQALAAYLV